MSFLKSIGHHISHDYPMDLYDVLYENFINFFRSATVDYNSDHAYVIEQFLNGLGYDKNNMPKSDWRILYRIAGVYTILSQQSGKTSTIILIGASNSGKTLVTNILSSNLASGAFHGMHSRSQFWLQDLPGKDIYIGEELILDQFNVDYFKLLLEGSNRISVDVKHKPSVPLPKKPLLVTGNAYIWEYVSRHESAFRNRCMLIRSDCNMQLNLSYDYHKYPSCLKDVKYNVFNELFKGKIPNIKV